MEYTPTNLKAVIDAIIKANGAAEITGDILNEILTHFIDSCVFKSQASDSGLDMVFTDTITLESLDEENSVEKIHSLSTTAPLVAIWKNNGEILRGMNYSAKAIDSNTIEITFEDPPTSGFPYTLLVWRKVLEITESLDFISVLSEDFYEAWEGSGYNTNPVGWYVYTTLANGTPEDHINADHYAGENDGNGALMVNHDTGTEYILVLDTDRYVENLETYNITFEYRMTSGDDIEIKIFGETYNLTGSTTWQVFDQNIQANSQQKFSIKMSSEEDDELQINNLYVEKQ